MLFMTITRVASLIAYDCKTQTLNMTSISLINTPECIENHPNISYGSTRLIITQSSNIGKGTFQHCLLEADNLLTRCGKTIDTSYESGFFSEFIRISNSQCTDAIFNGKLTLRYRSFSLDADVGSIGSLSFESHGSIHQGSCSPGSSLFINNIWYHRPIISTKLTYFLGQGEMQVSFDKDLISLPNGETCKYSLGKCFTPNYGNIFWELDMPKCEENRKILVYSGEGLLVKDEDNDESYVQVNHDGYDFQILLTKNKLSVCGFPSFRTEHPNLFATILDNHNTNFPITERGDPQELSLMNYLNSKLIYTMRHTRREVNRLFSIFSKDRCETRNIIMKNMMSIAVLSPMEFAYTYGGPGHTAIIRGEVIYLAKCTPTSVTPDVNRTGCYHELPVVNDGKRQFMSPRSRILIDVGTQIECLLDMPSLFLFGNDWYQMTPRGLIRSESPSYMGNYQVDYEFKILEGLSSGGLYSDATITQYQTALISKLTVDVINNRVAGNLEGKYALPEGYGWSNGFSDRDFRIIEKRIGGWWDSFGRKATQSGSWFGFSLLVFATWKMIIYSISCFVNFAGIKNEVGLLLALPICLFESISNMVLHGKLLKKSRADMSID